MTKNENIKQGARNVREEHRVLRVMTNLITLKRLEDGIRTAYGHEIERAYRQRYRKPSEGIVRPALDRLIRYGHVARVGEPMDLYQMTPLGLQIRV